MATDATSAPVRSVNLAGNNRAGLPLIAAVAIFFVSGVPALVYQLVWQRLLALHSGVGIYSVAMIVAAFMAGLGIGAALGGLISARVSHAGALRGFALVELAIAAFATASVWLYYDLLYLRGAWLYAASWRVALCHFLALLPPTALMGMSLPLLVRAVVTNPAEAPRRIGILYGVNGLGAAFGAAITPWLLIRAWGIPGAVYFGVVANVVAGLAALLFGLRSTLASNIETTAFGDERPQPAVVNPLPLGLWALLYATSGFCALGLEIVWFRLIDTAVKSTAFTFGTVLGLYLLGLSCGSLAGAVMSPRLRRPLDVFLACQAVLAAYTVVLVCALAYAPPHAPGLHWYVEYWSRSEPFLPGNLVADAEGGGYLFRLYILFPALVLGVPTFLMGLSFAVLQRAVQDDERTSGRKVGLLQAANIAGSTLGSLVVGLVALDWFGTAGTLRLLTVLGAGFAILGFRFGARRAVFATLTAGLLAGAVALPDQQALWSPLHGSPQTPAPYFAEDASGIVALKYDPRSRLWNMYVNGKAHSQLPYKNSPFEGTHVLLGTLPTLLHPEPRSVAIIGLGSGSTAWAAGCRSQVERLRVFEICAPEQELIRRIAVDQGFPEMQAFLADRRIAVEIVDGRNGVVSGNELYDVIEADATRPSTAYSGHLYSREFFTQCAARLKPGGVMCTWAPTNRTYLTFCEVFPHVVAVNEALLIGSRTPIAIEADEIFGRLREPQTAGYLGPMNVSLVTTALQTLQRSCPQAYAGAAPNDDLHPYDEFYFASPYNEGAELVERIIQLNLKNRSGETGPLRQRLLRVQPELPLAFWIEGRSLANEGRDREALAMYDDALNRAPCYAGAQLDRAVVTARLADDAQTEQQFRRAAELLPCNALAELELARCAARRSDVPAAIEHLRRALVRDEANWEAVAELAKLQLRGDHTATANALQLARRASELSGRSVVAVEELLADALLAAGQPAEAARVLRRLVDLCMQRDDQPALQRTRRRLDDLQGADAP